MPFALVIDIILADFGAPISTDNCPDYGHQVAHTPRLWGRMHIHAQAIKYDMRHALAH